MRKSLVTSMAAAVLVLGTSMPAHAASYLFNFNSLSGGTAGQNNGSNNTAIAAYFNAVLGSGAVTVSAGAIADASYDGDGHVVGTTTSSTSITLGTSDGGVLRTGNTCSSSTSVGCYGNLDTFIRNVNGTPSWDFTFNNGIIIDSVSFDYEIFPDGTCTDDTPAACGGTGLPNLPDMTVTANVTQLFHYYGAAPASAVRSPFAPIGTELAPQLIGTYTYAGGSLNATKLTFADWPAMIGIDNLNLTYHTNTNSNAVPEPASMLLLGSGLAGLYARRKKRNA